MGITKIPARPKPQLIVFKYGLTAAVGDITKVMVPKGAKILHGGVDPSGAVCVWIEEEVGSPKTEPLQFTVYQTGTAFDYAARHIATFQREWFIGHIYEV